MYAKKGEQRRSEVAATFDLEGEGRANGEWTLCSGVKRQICADADPVIFDLFLKE